MKEFYLKVNKSKDPGGEITRRVTSFLEGKGVKVKPVDALKDENRSAMSDACCIVLGGDGTMLEASHDVFHFGLPLVGVNLGTVGYLSEIEPSRIEEALSQILEGDFDIEERMMLRGELDNGFSYASLNDIVVARHGHISVNRFEVRVNDQVLNTYQADGIILATPTGSTGYNMSAGGPIVDPKAQMTLMTPICPASLSSRSIVLSASDTVSVHVQKADGDEGEEVAVSFDGSAQTTMLTGGKLTVRRSAHVTRLIRLERLSFMEVLYRKIRK